MQAGNYYLTWKFDIRDGKTTKPKMGKPLEVYTVLTEQRENVDGVTLCTIRDNDGDELARGVAFKSVGDRHNKSIARKISLKRALDLLCNGLDAKDAKKLRTKIWETYFNVSR